MNSFHSGLLCMHILKYAADICSSLVILFIMRSALSCLPCCRRISRVRFKVQRRAENTSTALCNWAAAPVLYSTHMRTKVYLHASWKHVWFIFFWMFVSADRKAVISQGQLKCVGSSLYLKIKCGVGYHLRQGPLHWLLQEPKRNN